PMLPGWAVTDIDFDGQHLAAGGRVVIDIQGTDLDTRAWEHPHRFDPNRFLSHPDYERLTAFIPHGGGDVRTGHRCPGEKLAIAGLAAAIATLSDPRLTVLDSGLRVDRRRLPTMPASGGTVRATARDRGCPISHRTSHTDTRGEAS